MIKTISITVILLFFITPSQGQKNNDTTYITQGTIQCYHKYGKFFIDGVVVDWNHLSPYIERHKEASQEYRLFLRKERLSTFINIVGLAGFITAITQLPGKKWDALAFLGGSFITFSLGFNIHCNGMPHLNKAVNLYNASLFKR